MYIFAKFDQRRTMNAIVACHLYLKLFLCMPPTLSDFVPFDGLSGNVMFNMRI